MVPEQPSTQERLAHIVNEELKQFMERVEDGLTDEELSDLFLVDRGAMVEALGPLLRQRRAELQLRIRRAMLKATEDGKHPEILLWMAQRYLTPREAPQC